MLMKICLVAAMAQNRVIGRGLEIPWKIKGEQLRFRELTLGKVMVMGRLTYESIGRPLPKRTTVVLTKDADYQAKGCIVMTSMDEVKRRYADESEIMIAGGGRVYQETILTADTLYLTLVEKDIEGDIFFPDFDMLYLPLLMKK